MTIIETETQPVVPDQVPPGPGEGLAAAGVTADPAADGTGQSPPALTVDGAPTERPVNPLLVGASTFLAVAGTGWMFAGVFSGVMPKAVALLGAAVGVGLVTLSYRMSRPTLLQYAAGPIALVVGAVLVLPFVHGGSANLVTLVKEAVTNGGIAHPPVSFDPGWRFLLLMVIAVLGITSMTAAMTLRRPKLGLVLPAPLTLVGALIQPASAGTMSAAVPLALFLAAFGVAYGADLAKDGATSGKFELRRLSRGLAVLVGLVVALALLSSSGFLLPKSQKQPIIPPEFPRVPPPADVHRPLFAVDLPQPEPLRLGVLDVYDKNGWLTPPFDVSRFQTVPDAGTLIAGHDPGELPALPSLPPGTTPQTVTFRLADLGGHALPDVANPLAVSHHGFALQYDPRTQALRLPDERAANGMTYTESAPPLPNGKELQKAGPPPAALHEYLHVPPPPPLVNQLLSMAPRTNSFVRLQYIRDFYYKKLIAAGPGNPVRVPPARVDDFLRAKPASPFEIVAGEVLLARWAGVPARMGYGYYSTTPATPKGRTYKITPADGAVWLEAYFDGAGWVPIVGTPPKAQPNIDTNPKKHNNAIHDSGRLDMNVYVPVKASTVQQLYTIVRYWAYRALPLIVLAVLALVFYPGPLKSIRRYRRRRWARARGMPERLAVAYADLRDAAHDLNLGDVSMTPLEFAAAGVEDAEHRELAWLLTRALWGDLRRDLRLEDVDAAEEMATSVMKRIRRANPMFNRLIAYATRVSLRDPYSAQVPNLWHSWHPVRRVRRALSALTAAVVRPLRRRPRLRLPRALSALLVALGVSSCAMTPMSGHEAAQMPTRVVPTAIAGLVFHEETDAEKRFHRVGAASLVTGGRIWTIHEGNEVQGDLQVAAFKTGYSSRLRRVRQGVLNGVGARNFKLTRFGDQKVYVAELPSEVILMWFAPNGRYYELLDARAQFARAESLFVALLAYQQGGNAAVVNTAAVPKPDPRQGGDG
jgi:transglutaminase-like putative cysteine protease